MTINGVKFYGSPWVPECFGVFNLSSNSELQQKWSAIPQDVDFLITHGPPRNLLDLTVTAKKCWL